MSSRDTSIRAYAKENLRHSFVFWEVGERVSVLLGFLAAGILAALSLYGISVVIDAGVYQWIGAGLGLWFVFLVLVVTPYRMWCDHVAENNALNERLRPKIQLRFEETDEFRKQVIFRSADLTRQGSGISIRGKAETDSEVPIPDCSAYVTKVEFQGADGSFSKIAPYERQKLKWALERDEFAPVTIAKDAPAHFGIAQAPEQGQAHFSIPTQSYSHSHPPVFRDHGTYRLTIIVTSTGSVSASMLLLICWNGEWFNIEAHLDGT